MILTPRPRRALLRRRAAVVSALLAVLCASCGSATASSTPPTPSVALNPVTAPLATSLGADGATWATVPMGQLGDALNTFWQLFVLPAGSSTWELRTPPDIATNGGLVVAGTASRLLAGVLPTNLLRFSTVETTSDRGVTWTTGVPPSALAASPDALTATGVSGADALLAGSAGRVVSESGNLSSWTAVTTAHILAAQPAVRACDPTAITALGPGSASAQLIGVACARPGVAGIVGRSGGGWRLEGPHLPASLTASPVTVIRLLSTATGASALLAARSATGATLIAASSTGGSWGTSSALRLSGTDPLRATGPTATGGIWALTGGAHPGLHVADPGQGWVQLPPPPAPTQTVAFPPTGGTDAFAVNGAVLSVWHLGPRARAWVRAQKITVPLQYGSSGG